MLVIFLRDLGGKVGGRDKINSKFSGGGCLKALFYNIYLLVRAGLKKYFFAQLSLTLMSDKIGSLREGLIKKNRTNLAF